MDEEQVDPEYKKGFNDGYLLTKTDEKLSDEFIRRRKENPPLKDTPREKGMADGIYQARVEIMQKDLDEIFEKNNKRGLSH